MLLKSFTFQGAVVEIVQDDITRQDTDAIVNAANSYLKHGGGVAAAIVRAGGGEIQRESDEYVKRYGPVPVSQVAVTGAGKLKARYVLHVVGPRWGEGNEHEKLYRAVQNVLRKAEELSLSSISIPAISSGIFGFPKDQCAEIFYRAISDFLKEHPETSLKLIRLCNIDEETSRIFLSVFEKYWR
ncbi:MAG: Appr-1-p processing domain protein [Thermotoga sp. 50_1627]|uniref:macro domain-containing protein n=1 Tax=Pseudothermotoga sp. TaxID=2033661 RepID=UPI00076C2796|nr:MAG: Appr-1-p processing domain protein [Thermotoga sp. 50_64]KUK25889.1 MAG: Appr-1-p processing domain protein [Thermotoga sp. 50_1627]MBC7116128.1 macro domain-containing protein [Pseudothermotoga sp.]MDK2922817.1 O-acetyl-ADP-ribose deacetylase [Pseudothermotoga sp.]HBT38550.1 Appr-1-p processing protein [Pseudothermotoga sp.]